MSYDVAIVGGGIIGGAVAFELARAKLRVVVLDRQQPGMEASWAAAGMLAPGAETPDSLAVAPLGKLSLELYPQFVAAIEEASGQRVGFHRDAALHLFMGDSAEHERDAFIALHRGLGLPAEAIPIAEAHQREPALGPAARAAAWMPHEARVDARALTAAVLAAARTTGVEVRSGIGVTSLVMNGRRAVGVIAGSESLTAGNVVVAAGSFTGAMEAFARHAPTRPIRGQMLALRSEKVRVGRVLRSSRGYIVPRDDGRMICGSTSEDAGYEKRVTPEGMQQILNAAAELAPAVADAKVVETWSGLRPDTPDHLPVLGPTDVEGLLMATGHYRNGILLTPVTAKLLREWIVDGKTSLPSEQFSPMRFAKPSGQPARNRSGGT